MTHCWYLNQGCVTMMLHALLCCLIGTCDLVLTDCNSYPAVSLIVIVGPPLTCMQETDLANTQLLAS